MAKETVQERIAVRRDRTMITTALISSATTLLVGLVVAFLAFPPFQEWVRNRGNEQTYYNENQHGKK
jgi:hypothetical protein